MKHILSFFMLAAAVFNMQAAKYPDVHLIGDEQVQHFCDSVRNLNSEVSVRINVNNFTIEGDVKRATWADLPNRLDTIFGAASFIGLDHYLENPSINDSEAITGIEPFFSRIVTQGSIIFRGCPFIAWPGTAFNNEYNPLKVIHGDLIVDDCANFPNPGSQDWPAATSYGMVEEIEGNFIISNFGKNFTRTSLINLKKVGGDFIIRNPKMKVNDGNMNRLGCTNLKEIGGDLIIDGYSTMTTAAGDPVSGSFRALNCFSGLNKVGGAVKIINCPLIQDYAWQEGTDSNWGYCYIKFMIDEGMIDCNNGVRVGMQDNLRDLNLISGCYDGGIQVIGYDGNPADVYDLIPTPCTFTDGIKSTKVDAFANAIIKDDMLYINSNEKLAKIELFNVTGACAARFAAGHQGMNTFNVGGLPQNLYILKVTANNGKISVLKVIK